MPIAPLRLRLKLYEAFFHGQRRRRCRFRYDPLCKDSFFHLRQGRNHLWFCLQYYDVSWVPNGYPWISRWGIYIKSPFVLSWDNSTGPACFERPTSQLAKIGNRHHKSLVCRKTHTVFNAGISKCLLTLINSDFYVLVIPCSYESTPSIQALRVMANAADAPWRRFWLR